MIEINLTPKQEIQSMTWFVPDLLVLFAVILSSLFYSHSILSGIESEIESLKSGYEATSIKLRSLSAESKNYYTLKKRLETIHNKIFAISKLTQNITRHYKPLILVETLQSHRPNNLWLRYIEHDEENSLLKIGGAALESKLIATFIQKLKKSKDAIPLESQFLSQIYFSQIALEKIAKSESSMSLNQTNEVDAKLLQAINKDDSTSSNSINTFPQYSLNSFSDVKGYPEFRLNLKYDLREKSL